MSDLEQSERALADVRKPEPRCPCHGIRLHRLPSDHEPVLSGGLVYSWYHPSGRWPQPPSGKWSARVTHNEALAESCETCGAQPTAECDGSIFFMFLLPFYVRDIGRVHACRYQAAIGAAEDER